VPPGEPVPIIKGSHVYLIDGSGYIFRAFHALPPLTRPSDGLPVGAVHGFCAMLWKLLQDARKGSGPTHLAVIFDASEKTFRNEIYKDYKAHRPPAPEELVPQFSLIRDAVKAFNIACLEQDGFEADDLIATYARQVVAAGGDTTIVSSDKDLMQLIQPGIVMLDTMKNRTIGPDEVRERFGVPPNKVVDVQALAGDSTDNIPGVPGIGVKTAAELINEYGDLETLLARAGEIKQPKRRERLTEFALRRDCPSIWFTLKQDVPVAVPVEQLGVRDAEPEKLLGFLREMEFATLTKRIAEGLGAEAPPPVERSVGSTVSRAGEPATAATAKAGAKPATVSSGASPQAAVALATSAAKAKIDRSKYETVTELSRLEAWLAEARAAGRFAFDIETTSLDAMQAEFVGFSLATAPGRACYVPARAPRRQRLRFQRWQAAAGPAQGGAGADEALCWRTRRPQDRRNLKYDCLVLRRYGIELSPSTTPCCSPMRSTAAAASTGWTHFPSATWGTLAFPSSMSCSMPPAPRSRTRPSARCPSTRRRSTPPRTPTSPCGYGWC
jgi:DNA polymerase-1